MLPLFLNSVVIKKCPKYLSNHIFLEVVLYSKPLEIYYFSPHIKTDTAAETWKYCLERLKCIGWQWVWVLFFSLSIPILSIPKVPGGQGVGCGGVVVSWMKPIEMFSLRLSQEEQKCCILILMEKRSNLDLWVGYFISLTDLYYQYTYFQYTYEHTANDDGGLVSGIHHLWLCN